MIVIVHRNAAYIIFQIKENSYLLLTQIEKQKYSTLLDDKLYYNISKIIIIYFNLSHYTILFWLFFIEL